MTLLSAQFTSWKIKNLDTNEEIEGDFEAQNVTQDFKASYAEAYPLNSSRPITQFLHSDSSTISFQGRFFYDPAAFSIVGSLGFPGEGIGTVIDRFGSDIVPESKSTTKPAEKLAKLEEWTRRIDKKSGRPAIVEFSIGDEHSMQAVIESVSNITFDRPFATGEVRGVAFTITLKEYTEYALTLENITTNQGFSRSHHAKKGDYYELVAAKEYDSPILGDHVRSLNPTQPIMRTGSVVRFPSHSAVRLETVSPRSIALSGLDTKVPSPQRTLRQRTLERLNRPYTTFAVPEGL